MKTKIVIACILLGLANISFAIDPTKYDIGMDYETIKKAIFEDKNLVSWFDASTIQAVSTESGEIEVKFDGGKAIEISIVGISKNIFSKYTDALKKLLADKATVVSARLSRNPNNLGGAYLWKLPGVEIEEGLFYDPSADDGEEASFQIIKRKVVQQAATQP